MTPIEILKSVCAFNAYPRLSMALCLVLCVLALDRSVNAGEENKTVIIKFDAPGAGTAPNQGTVAFGLNLLGTVVGYTRDTNFARHGFLRTHSGSFITFDDPAAGTCSANCGAIGNGQGTRGYSINVFGEVAGFFTDNTAHCHGFIRSPNGTFTQIDAPDAGQGPFPQGTFVSEITPMGINAVGVVIGFYVDASSVQHGFVRSPEGKITEFDPPGSTFTETNAIDLFGNVVGFYFDANSVGYGYLRDPRGNITKIDAPGADHTPGSFNGTFCVGITLTGEIEGVFVDSNFILHGFTRSPQGKYTTYNVPAAGTGPGQGTLPESNDDLGDIAGNYFDANGVNHGFLRHVRGGLSTFDAPGGGTSPGQGTIPSANSDTGAVTGQLIDSNNVVHGFLLEGL
ncbi:MAG: hypothetical protein JO201_00915 [Verrucomicrobia bacterium]|nr:hypothetical protein [Verrucomicrobiota bacterium]